LLCALIIKLGAAPFHYWFPSVSGGVSWTENFFLITTQKIAPLILVRYLVNLSLWVTLVVFASTYVGRMGGLNQSSLRKLIAFSSINHLGWLLMSSFFGYKYLIIYFLIYCLTNGVLVYTLSYLNYYYLSQLFYYRPRNLFLIIIYLNWLSFGGLPPFIGFFPKWVLIDRIVSSGLLFVCLFIVVIRLVSLYYYTRVCYVAFTQSNRTNFVLSSGRYITRGLIYTSVMVLFSLVYIPLFVFIL
jgi:NADH-ubiquinone oxidoreductase chain 2